MHVQDSPYIRRRGITLPQLLNVTVVVGFVRVMA
jgi:hypothetical protein